MMGPTHRALAVTTSTVLCVAAKAPVDSSVIIVGSAWATAKLPDIDCKSWFPAKHRTWTHWLITTILVAVGIGLIIYGIGQGVAALVDGPNGVEIRRTAREGGVLFGVLVGIGTLCGTISHALSDACTDGGHSGVPLFGPFSRRGVWLMPEPMRCKVNPVERDRNGEPKKTEGGSEKRSMSAGERCWLIGAWATTYVLITLALFGDQIVAFLHDLSS